VSIELAGEKAGQWYDHEAERGGHLFGLIRERRGLDDAGVYGWLTELGIGSGRVVRVAPRPVEWRETGRWDYRDATGEPVYRVIRKERNTPTAIPRTHTQVWRLS
jgi:putative DNA primase/helicase